MTALQMTSAKPAGTTSLSRGDSVSGSYIYSGATEKQLSKCRQHLEAFIAEMLAPFGRSERRHWGSVYVRGLLLNE